MRFGLSYSIDHVYRTALMASEECGGCDEDVLPCKPIHLYNGWEGLDA
jgi:hypothetical protein